jgi:hypothetical protein
VRQSSSPPMPSEMRPRVGEPVELGLEVITKRVRHENGQQIKNKTNYYPSSDLHAKGPAQRFQSLPCWRERTICSSPARVFHLDLGSLLVQVPFARSRFPSRSGFPAIPKFVVVLGAARGGRRRPCARRDATRRTTCKFDG